MTHIDGVLYFDGVRCIVVAIKDFNVYQFIRLLLFQNLKCVWELCTPTEDGGYKSLNTNNSSPLFFSDDKLYKKLNIVTFNICYFGKWCLLGVDTLHVQHAGWDAKVKLLI